MLTQSSQVGLHPGNASPEVGNQQPSGPVEIWAGINVLGRSDSSPLIYSEAEPSFVVTERIYTNRPKEEVLRSLEDQFRNVSKGVSRIGDTLQATMIDTSLGSAHRLDTTSISIRKADGGYLVVADVNYKPSVFFWICLILFLFTYIGWCVPILFYIAQKKTVRTAIRDCFQRTKNELNQQPFALQGATAAGAAPQILPNDLVECPFCAELIRKNATLCRYCHSQIERQSDHVSESSRECPFCCEMTPISTNVCLHCESKLSNPVS